MWGQIRQVTALCRATLAVMAFFSPLRVEVGMGVGLTTNKQGVGGAH